LIGLTFRFIQKSKEELEKELNTNIEYLQKKNEETTVST
jgi:hypothetical protein